MRGRKGLAAAAALAGLLAASSALAAEAIAVPEHPWPFQGLFGSFDRSALRRGFQVYREVCAGCHSMGFIAYRNLADIGFDEDQIKAIAETVSVQAAEPNEDGEIVERPGRPSDPFKAPFPNEQAARAANGGALPPDLSLVVKARAGGADYVRALLTGYREAPPAGVAMPEGMNYNDYFPGHQIAMPPPLSEGVVEYADGTEATVARMAEDVTSFLAWTAEPELEERKRMGIKVVLYLLVLTGMLYALKRKIWSDVH